MTKEFKTLRDLEKWWTKPDGLIEIEIAEFMKQLKQEAIKWVKLIRSMEYGQRLCLNCMKIYGGGNNGKQYCCRGKDGELHFVEEQTGSSVGAIEILMKTNNITEEDLK